MRTHSAFTLVELLVSLAVLGLALSVVGVVFSITTKTVTQAAALSESQALLRQFELQLEEDLKYCDPARSVLIIHGRTQAAGRTRDDLGIKRFWRVLTGDPGKVKGSFNAEFDAKIDAEYSNPRADVLSFFTMRPASSQAPPLKPSDGASNILVRGAKLAPLHVVYGHAAIGVFERLADGTYAWTDDLTHIETDDNEKHSPLPLTGWHLSRRATLIQNLVKFSTYGLTDFVYDKADWQRLLTCAADDTHAGDVAEIAYAELMNQLQRYADLTPYERSPNAKSIMKDITVPRIVNQLLYPNNSEAQKRHHVATVAAEPPIELRSNLGVQLLGGCAWFEVEFLMPEDPRNAQSYWDPREISDPTNANRRTDMPRWTKVKDGETYVFVPDTPASREVISGLADPNRVPNGRLLDFGRTDFPITPAGNTVANRQVRTWPYAIRVTVKVFDRNGRLSDPIERSIVHRFD
ncbi:MAG: hypothetical protein CHACPFDD_01240 [Phycisphaerae bacterium]|nr:hypothetical protein [Phycisphaerae bacterium]